MLWKDNRDICTVKKILINEKKNDSIDKKAFPKRDAFYDAERCVRIREQEMNHE